MNKKFKQFLAILATGVLSVGTAGMLSACGSSKDGAKDDDNKVNQGDQINHTAENAWQSDENNHWHLCATDANDSHKYNWGAHDWAVNGETYTCTVCGYQKNVSGNNQGSENPGNTGNNEEGGNESGGENEHVAASTWQTNEESHWHGCAADANDDHTYNLGAHTWTVNGATYTCTVCGYEKTETVTDVNDLHVQTLQTAWQNMLNNANDVALQEDTFVNGAKVTTYTVSFDQEKGIGFERFTREGEDNREMKVFYDVNKNCYVYYNSFNNEDDQYASTKQSFAQKYLGRGSANLSNPLEVGALFDETFDSSDAFVTSVKTKLNNDAATVDYVTDNGVMTVTISSVSEQQGEERILTFTIENGILTSITLNQGQAGNAENNYTIDRITFTFDQVGFDAIDVSGCPENIDPLPMDVYDSLVEPEEKDQCVQDLIVAWEDMMNNSTALTQHKDIIENGANVGTYIVSFDREKGIGFESMTGKNYPDANEYKVIYDADKDRYVYYSAKGGENKEYALVEKTFAQENWECDSMDLSNFGLLFEGVSTSKGLADNFSKMVSTDTNCYVDIDNDEFTVTLYAEMGDMTCACEFVVKDGGLISFSTRQRAIFDGVDRTEYVKYSFVFDQEGYDDIEVSDVPTDIAPYENN